MYRKKGSKKCTSRTESRESSCVGSNKSTVTCSTVIILFPVSAPLDHPKIEECRRLEAAGVALAEQNDIAGAILLFGQAIHVRLIHSFILRLTH